MMINTICVRRRNICVLSEQHYIYMLLEPTGEHENYLVDSGNKLNPTGDTDHDETLTTKNVSSAEGPNTDVCEPEKITTENFPSTCNSQSEIKSAEQYTCTESTENTSDTLCEVSSQSKNEEKTESSYSEFQVPQLSVPEKLDVQVNDQPLLSTPSREEFSDTLGTVESGTINMDTQCSNDTADIDGHSMSQKEENISRHSEEGSDENLQSTITKIPDDQADSAGEQLGPGNAEKMEKTEEIGFGNCFLQTSDVESDIKTDTGNKDMQNVTKSSAEIEENTKDNKSFENIELNIQPASRPDEVVNDKNEGENENPAYLRSESKGFEPQGQSHTEEKADVNDSESVCSSSKSENSSKEDISQEAKVEKASVNGNSEVMEVDNTPSPYPESEFSEMAGPQTPASVYSVGDSMSVPAYETMGPPTPASSVTDSVSVGPTPSKRCRTGINTNEAPITASKLYEYHWPQEESGEYYMLQEQISEYLHVKSFKRKYPDLMRRQVDIKERVFLLEKGAVSETQADLGLTAVRSDEVYDLMMRDYPAKYQEYLHVVHERQKQKISEKHKEYGVPKLEKGKMTQYIKKAMKSAAEWNSHILRERREERRAYLDLQTFNIHYPIGKYKKLPPEATKVSPYPVALIPGQFQDHHKKYSPAELKYFPLNTALFNPPKKMDNTLANPKEAAEGETASEEDTNATGSESDSDESSSGSDDSSQKEEGEQKTEGGGETKEAAPSSAELCRICELGKSEDIKGQNDLVCCSECKKVGHPSCLDLTGEMVSVVKTYPWQCMDCKTCVECMDPYDEDKMMFCDLCDRGYHTFCVGLKNIPNGRWKCRSCKGPETPKTPKSAKTTRGRGRGRGRGKGGGANEPGTPTGRSQATPTPPPALSSTPSPAPAPVTTE